MSIREITHHHVEGKVANLRVVVVDDPGEGGACHNYCFYSSDKNYISVIQFQNGPIQEVGVNGVQNEALLAIIIINPAGRPLRESRLEDGYSG